MACTVVCISHATGSGGEDVGRRVAEQLGYLYVDEDIVAWAAAQGGITPEDVADEERRKSSVLRLVETLLVGTAGGSAWMLAGAEAVVIPDVPLSPEIRTLIRETVAQTAARGKVVIVAHAASHVVERGPGALRVLVTASPTTRAQRVAAMEGLEPKEAERVIKESDAGRRDYLKRFYAIDRESPTQYDLVINTDVLSSAEAAEIVNLAARRNT